MSVPLLHDCTICPPIFFWGRISTSSTQIILATTCIFTREPTTSCSTRSCSVIFTREGQVVRGDRRASTASGVHSARGTAVHTVAVGCRCGVWYLSVQDRLSVQGGLLICGGSTTGKVFSTSLSTKSPTVSFRKNKSTLRSI